MSAFNPELAEASGLRNLDSVCAPLAGPRCSPQESSSPDWSTLHLGRSCQICHLNDKDKKASYFAMATTLKFSNR